MSYTILAKYNMHKKKQVIEWYLLGKKSRKKTIEDYLTELKGRILKQEKVDINCSSLSKR